MDVHFGIDIRLSYSSLEGSDRIGSIDRLFRVDDRVAVFALMFRL